MNSGGDATMVPKKKNPHLEQSLPYDPAEKLIPVVAESY
jgi:hypothetical protein